MIPRRYRILFAIAQGLALLLGGFTLLTILGELRYPGFDANLWWIDLRFANRIANRVLLFAIAIWLLGFALRPQFAPCRSWLGAPVALPSKVGFPPRFRVDRSLVPLWLSL